MTERIETVDFILRPWKEEDAQGLLKIANNKKIYDNLRDGFPHPYTLEDAKKYISVTQNANELSNFFAIEIDGRIAGSIGAFIKEDVYRLNAEIGYYLGEEYWGKGIMSKAIKELVKYMFKNFDIIRIYAEPFERNTGSRKALENAGFKLEAVLKNNVVKNGVIESSCIYALLRDDFLSKPFKRNVTTEAPNSPSSPNGQLLIHYLLDYLLFLSVFFCMIL